MIKKTYLETLLFNLCFKPLLFSSSQVEGLIPHLVDGGVSILRYANDTILFVSHDIEKALNMKLILCIFKQLYGVKINFYQSKKNCFGRAKEMEGQ